MALQLSNVTAALKEVVLPYIKDNFPKDKILVDQMKRNAGVTFMNDEFIAPVWTSRHGGVANLADDGNSVISASGRSSSRGTVSVKIPTGAFDISKLVIDATKTVKGAVENMLNAQAQTLSTDFGRHINRMMYGDGHGVISQARQSGGSVGEGTIAIESLGAGTGPDDGRVEDMYGTINADLAPNKYFAVGQTVAIGTAGVDLGTVASITGTSIVVTGAPAIVASDSIYLADGSGEGAGTSEFDGLKGALSSSTGTSTYAGLARSNQGWTPSFGSASEALTLSRMEDSYLAAREYAQSGDTFVIIVNKSLFKKYGDILTAMRRTVDKADLLGGFKGLEFAAGDGNVGVFLDYDCPDGAVFILDMDSWTLCQVNDINWLEDPSGGGLLRLQNTLTYQAVLHWFANMLCLSPGANGQETRKTD
jgi:hypothetical protein